MDAAHNFSMNIPEKAIFAFNANIDHVKTANKQDLDFIESFSPTIFSQINESFSWGVQREVSISSNECDFFLKKIKFGRTIVGGQAGNAAQFASALGVNCFLHGNYVCRDLASLFSFPQKIFIAQKNLFVSADSPFTFSKSSHHFVLENAENKTRFIASFDPFPLHIEENFSRNISDELPYIGKAFVGGIHLIPTHERVNKFASELSRWKKINPNLKIFLELGEFQNNEVRESIMEYIFPCVDYIGMNDLELSMLGCEPEELCNNATLLIHSPESHSVFPEEKLDEDALLFAKKCASFKAKYGRCATMQEIDAYTGGYVENPIRTVGLGDVFSCAYFLAV